MTVKQHSILCHGCLASVFVDCWNPCSVLRQTAPLTAVTAALVKAHGTAVLQTLAMAISLRMAACVMKRHDVELSLLFEFITVKSFSLTHWMIKHVLHNTQALTGVSLVDSVFVHCRQYGSWVQVILKFSYAHIHGPIMNSLNYLKMKDIWPSGEPQGTILKVSYMGNLQNWEF